jgi:hypothetical protein
MEVFVDRRLGLGVKTVLAGALMAGCVGRAQAAEKVEVTDAQVVAAMRKGIDYLLKHKKGDNWEPENQEKGDWDATGGVTALALYALLHAGESLQDDPEYHAKLSWRGPELAPVVQYVNKMRTPSTYPSSLQALALTLVPKKPDEKWGEGVQPGLWWARNYLVCGMNHQGGYTYGPPGASKDYFPGILVPKGYPTVFAFWEAYCASGGKMKKEADDFFGSQRSGSGGWQWAAQQLMTELRGRKSISKDSRETAKLDVMMRELEKYTRMQRLDADYRKQLADAKADVAKKERSGTKGDALESAKTWVKTLQRATDENFQQQGDLSNSQYAALGAWSIMDIGMEMPNAYWTTTDNYWRKIQMPDGSWAYDLGNGEKEGSRDTMGIAGIATLYVCQEFVDTELRLTPKPDKNLDRALAWLHKAYKPGSTDLYYLYGAERIGLASGMKHFGTVNWYAEGAATLVKMQKPEGHWAQWRGPGVIDTSYALLFLARGRNPIVFNKLEYKGPWNARARDDAYVTRWMSKKFERPINWQVVNLQVSPDEWLDAPIVLITGSQDPKFTKEDVDKLRAFVQAGGMIFSTSDGASASFTTAMKKYAEEVVGSKYEMRQLPRNHELFSKELGVDLPNPPPLLGVSNGVRELWIHSTGDVGADWQMRRYSTKSFELGSALYMYASGMGSLRSKLQPLAVDVGNAKPSRTVGVARVEYAGNFDPEPGAWARMAKLARADFKTEVKLSTVKCADLDPKKYPLAHLTGTEKVSFTDEDVAGLKKYVDGGGLLFIDAAGGNEAFGQSCEELIRKISDKPLEQVPADHPLFAGAMADGVKIDKVEMRKYATVKLQRRATTPQMQAVTVDGRVRILYSPWDVCSGFLGTSTWGVVGYSPASSEAIGRNLILYAAEPRK